MKRGFIIIFIFTLLIALCVVEDVFLKQNLELLDEKANTLLNLVISSENVNTEEITLEINNLKDFWNKTETLFCLVVNHINMEEAGEQISKIESFAILNKKDELIVEINLLIYYAESYQHIIVPNIQNIL